MEPTTTTEETFVILPATRNDMQKVYDLIIELADYEKLKHMVVGKVEDMEKFCFDEKIIEINCGWLKTSNPANDKIISYSLYFKNYSTFLCKPGIYLEDIYVQPIYRGRGYGKKMFLYISKVCYDRGYGRMEWSVLDWNQPSIDFYKSLGGVSLDDWTQFRLVGETLKSCAEKFDQFKI